MVVDNEREQGNARNAQNVAEAVPMPGNIYPDWMMPQMECGLETSAELVANTDQLLLLTTIYLTPSRVSALSANSGCNVRKRVSQLRPLVCMICKSSLLCTRRAPTATFESITPY